MNFEGPFDGSEQQGPLENGLEWGFRLLEHGVEWRDDSGEAIAAALIERGMLDPDPKGKAARPMTVPALGQSKRLYCINSRIFEGDNDG